MKGRSFTGSVWVTVSGSLRPCCGFGPRMCRLLQLYEMILPNVFPSWSISSIVL